MNNASETPAVWRCADTDPPPNEPEYWSRAVVGVTNLGNVHRVSFMASQDGGYWQRPRGLDVGECFVLWTDLPKPN